MKNLVLLLLSFSFSVPIIAQSDTTIYLDENLAACDQEQAKYKRYLDPINDSLYKIEDRYLDSTIFQQGFVLIESINPSYKKYINEGLFKRYFENGNLAWSGSFENNNKVGSFDYWYENGAKKGIFFFEDSLDMDHEFLVVSFNDSLGNPLVSDGMGIYTETDAGYKGTGPIKDGLKDGLWTGVFRKGYSTFEENYVQGKLQEGKSIDSLGQVHNYEKIRVQPVYKDGGLQGFYTSIMAKVRYPEKAVIAGIEGRVYVQFIIDDKGTVTEVKTVKGISVECDIQAEKAVSQGPNFSPGLYRGQPEKVKMVLPVVFKLQ